MVERKFQPAQHNGHNLQFSQKSFYINPIKSFANVSIDAVDTCASFHRAVNIVIRNKQVLTAGSTFKEPILLVNNLFVT